VNKKFFCLVIAVGLAFIGLSLTTTVALAASTLPDIVVKTEIGEITFEPWERISDRAVQLGRKLGQELSKRDKAELSVVGTTADEMKELEVLAGDYSRSKSYAPGCAEGSLVRGDLVATVMKRGGKLTRVYKYVAWDETEKGVEFTLSTGVKFVFPRCGNWTRRVGRIPEPPPPVEPPPPPPPESVRTPEAARARIKAGFEKDTAAYVGYIFSEKGHATLYWGANFTLYTPRREIGSGAATIQGGVRFSYGGWSGTPGSIYPKLKDAKYGGYQLATQGGGRLINGPDNVQVFGGYARRDDSFSAKQVDGRSESSQTAGQISLFSSADLRTPRLGPIKRIEAYLQGNLELSREVKATWNGKKVDDATGFETTNIGGGIDATLYEGKKIDAGVGVHGSHDFNDDDTTGLELRLFGSTKNRAIKLGAGAGYAWSKPGNGPFGNLIASSDLDPITDWLWDRLTGAAKPAPKNPVAPAVEVAPTTPDSVVAAPPVAPVSVSAPSEPVFTGMSSHRADP
jgi:hypothetical protein